MADPTDPLAEGRAYRASMLALCGDDDPAEVQSRTPDLLRALLLEAEGGGLRERPAPGEWSVLEILGHFTDAEWVWGSRYRWVIAEHEPPLPGYDQDRWVAGLAHNDAQPERLTRVFESLRAANLALWLNTTPEQRARAYVQSERGRETLDEMFHMIAGHDRFHLDQAERTLDAVRAKR